jgi:hypothetical protein
MVNRSLETLIKRLLIGLVDVRLLVGLVDVRLLVGLVEMRLLIGLVDVKLLVGLVDVRLDVTPRQSECNDISRLVVGFVTVPSCQACLFGLTITICIVMATPTDLEPSYVSTPTAHTS